VFKKKQRWAFGALVLVSVSGVPGGAGAGDMQVAAAAASPLVVPPPADHPAPLAKLFFKGAYDVYFGGMYAGAFTLEGRVDAGRYEVTTAVESRGWLDRIYSFRMNSRAEGVAGQTLTPSRYETRSSYSGKEQAVRIAYGKDGPETIEIEPKKDQEGRAPVPIEMQRGALDPLTALAAVLSNRSKTRPCEGLEQIFDGKRRFSMTMTPAGQEVLKASEGYGSFAGATQRCAVVVKRMKGFDPRFEQESRKRPPQPALVWFASPGGIPAQIPVKIQVNNPFGNMVIHLVDAELDQDGRAGKVSLAGAKPE